MQCKEIQELLKADYLDGELGPKDEQLIKEHLAQCPQCRGIERELKFQATLFQQLGQKEVPERIWQNIREKIMLERLNEEERFGFGFFGRLRNYLFSPKPVFVLARTLAVVIFVALFAGIFLRNESFFSTANHQNGNGVFYSLASINDDMVYDFGTSIEEYFL